MQLDVDRGDFRHTRIVDPPLAELDPGQVRVEIERFALTANNISYALSGDLLDYWGFFPTEAPWGRIPVMGYGTVTESANPGVHLGGRYFGFVPMATELIVDAEIRGSGFVDRAPHRRDHARAYVGFDDVASAPGFRADRSDEYLLVRGLFVTSFLVDDFLGDHDLFGAAQVLITSASSKTSIALAHCLTSREVASVGITSDANRDFVEDLGLYDDVITYRDIESTPTPPSVVVDMAGDAEVLATIHEHFGEALRYSCRVGATHWDRVDGAGAIPGPEPVFFFAPTQLAKRSAEAPGGEGLAPIGAALAAFLDAVPTWLTVEHSAGPEAVQRIYLDTLEGRASAATGHILSMLPNAFDL